MKASTRLLKHLHANVDRRFTHGWQQLDKPKGSVNGEPKCSVSPRRPPLSAENQTVVYKAAWMCSKARIKSTKADANSGSLYDPLNDSLEKAKLQRKK